MCSFQIAEFQAHESQQTKRSRNVEDVILFPKMRQALLGQLLGKCLVLLPHKEQTCQQVTHPAKTLLISQLLVEYEALLQQRTGLFELPLFGGGSCPFGIALALTPAIAQLLKEGSCLLQAGTGSPVLIPHPGDRAQHSQAVGHTRLVSQLPVEDQALLAEPLCPLHAADQVKGQGSCRQHGPRPQPYST